MLFRGKAQLVCELRRHRQSEEVWRRLGLSENQRNTLKQWLGINPMGVAASIEEIALREGKGVQAIRKRINSARHRVSVPTPHVRCPW